MQVRRTGFTKALVFTLAITGLVGASVQAQDAPRSNASSLALGTLGANTVADIAQMAAPAVVNIEVSESSQGMAQAMGLPEGMQFFFNGMQMNPQDFFNGGRGGGGHGGGGGNGGNGGGSGRNNGIQLPKRLDTGSGFIVRPDGYIVTNAHVVKSADDITVTLNDKRKFEHAKVVGIDHFSDLAVLKINADNLPTLKMGSSTGLRPGDFAIAIGSPLGYDHTVTLGIISAVGRTVTDVNGNINFIQTDAAINPGNSGGPLLNLSGEVIGVNTAIRRDAQNIGFSIPIDVAKQVSESLMASGKILRPWLGIKMHDLDDAMAKSLGVSPDLKGVVVVEFVDGSPARSAGMEVGDIIRQIDGKDMNTPKDVKDFVQNHKVSDQLHFSVMRKSALQAITVNVGDYQDVMDKHALAPR